MQPLVARVVGVGLGEDAGAVVEPVLVKEDAHARLQIGVSGETARVTPHQAPIPGV